MEEIWRPVKGYEGLYEVSNEGRVKSLKTYRSAKKGGILNGKSVSKRYYPQVALYRDLKRKQYSIHFLVVQAFPEVCGELFEGCHINHRNEVKTDNRAENLEVCTAKYNANYGTRNKKISEKRKSKPIIQLSLDGEFIRRWESAMDVEREKGYSHSNIAAACLGKHKVICGYKWEYAK